MTGAPPHLEWTSERETVLRKLWSDGLSHSEIAKEMGGTTRNAVGSKADRMDLPKRCAPPAKLKLVAPPVRKEHGKVGNRNGCGEIFRRGPGAVSTPDVTRGVALVDLLHHHCRAIVSGEGADARFCGNAKSGEGSYCAHHGAVYLCAPSSTRSELTRSLRKFA